MGFTFAQRTWNTDQDFPGTDEELALEMELWKFNTRPKGEAVMARDQDHGPLNARQFAVLTQKLLRDQPVTIGQAATFICKELGPNNRSIALMRVSDVHIFADPANLTQKSYQIDVPRIKKRLARAREVKRRPLSEYAGKVLEAIIAENHERFGKDTSDLPLFCRENPLQRPGHRFPWQCTTNDIHLAVVQYGEKCQLMVNGLAETKFRITPRRLRYTYGTRLAAEGASARQIAEALDHSNTNTAMVYINASLSMVDRLFEHMDARIAPIMDEFLGRMHKPTKGDVVIPGRRYSGALMASIGSCGSGTLCKLMPGFSCYVCRFYNPIAKAPHRESLEEAYAMRRQYQKLADNKADNAQLNFLDQVILGIQAAIAASEKWTKLHESSHD